MQSKILFMLRGGEVSRFHTVQTLKAESVGQHSFGVAWFCHLLNPDCSKELILAALAHDLAEQEVGDLPAPTKIKFGISESMGHVEDGILEGAGFGFELTREEKRLLKFADCFQGMLFCIRERSLGNRGVEVVFQRYREYVKERGPEDGSKAHEILWSLTSLWEMAKGGIL